MGGADLSSEGTQLRYPNPALPRAAIEQVPGPILIHKHAWIAELVDAGGFGADGGGFEGEVGALPVQFGFQQGDGFCRLPFAPVALHGVFVWRVRSGGPDHSAGASE